MNFRKIYLKTLIYSFLAIVFTSCKSYNPDAKEEAKAARGIDVKNLDTTVSPSDDFFMFANGGWIKNNPIPATESRWGSFNELRDKNREILKKILEEASSAKNLTKGSSRQLIGDFYFSGMDSTRIENEGIKPLQKELDRINNIKDINGLTDALAQLHRYGIYPFFGVYVDQDAKQSTQYALYLTQAGLGMPDRDYYTKNDKASAEIKAKYLQHITNMFKLMGEDEKTATKHAKSVLALETRLANASMTRKDSRDPHATYNKMSLSELHLLSSSFNWDQYFKSLGANLPYEKRNTIQIVDEVKKGKPSKGAVKVEKNIKERETFDYQTVIVSQPKFVKEVNAILKKPDLETIKAYLRWQLLHGTAPYLSSAFVNEHFTFNGTVLSGTKELEKRWKRVLDNTNSSLGEALGQEYVKVAFSPEAKRKAMAMVNNLKAALKDRIMKLDWMSDTTKQQALNKLNTIVVKIGYPDKWKSYDGLEINRESYVLNNIRSSEYEFQRMMNKLGKPIDRGEWFMTPPTVNAYYNPAMNEIVFPAGILQPPFFDAEADDAVNYGGMGAVIGHELTHGFDDQGKEFDAEGNLKNWWTKEDSVKFKTRSQAVVKQFNNYKVLDTVVVNGELTLGENIADLGGLTIAYEAFQKSLQGKERPGNIDGFTPEQRFFLGWAQVWRMNERPESTRQRIITDPHSPAKYRVNGPLSNMPEFYKAFNIQPGSKMMSPDSTRAVIW